MYGRCNNIDTLCMEGVIILARFVWKVKYYWHVLYGRCNNIDAFSLSFSLVIKTKSTNLKERRKFFFIHMYYLHLIDVFLFLECFLNIIGYWAISLYYRIIIANFQDDGSSHHFCTIHA